MKGGAPMLFVYATRGAMHLPARTNEQVKTGKMTTADKQTRMIDKPVSNLEKNWFQKFLGRNRTVDICWTSRLNTMHFGLVISVFWVVAVVNSLLHLCLNQ